MMINNLQVVGFVSVIFFFYSLNGYSAPESQDFELSEGTFDEQLVEISKRLPGFAGFYFDENENLVIVVSKDSEHKQPEDITQALLNSRTNINLPVLDDLLAFTSTHDLIIQEATYDFASLHTWRMAISEEIMSDPNVVFMDANERENRVVIGIEEINEKEKYLTSISALNIPLDAIIIKESPSISSSLLTTNTQAQEPATYDGRLLDIPLVEVNSQYFSDVKVILNADGTWELQSIGGSNENITLFDPDAEMFAPKLEVLTRDPDSNFAFQAIARVTEMTDDESCTSLTALPQQIDGNIITVAITVIKKLNASCTASLARRSIDIELDTEDLAPGLYIVKYRGKSGEFILP